MPRKRTQQKVKITVMVDEVPIAVVLHPPSGKRRSWYAYWPGLGSSRSTGESNYEKAVIVAGNMLRRFRAGDHGAGAGSAPLPSSGALSSSPSEELPMSDEEFEAIQKEHYAKKQGADAQARAAKSLQSCLEAIRAFRVISGLKPITLATPDDCAAFQRKALRLPKSTLHAYPNSKKDAACYSANTVVKWSVALQAAWERASRAGGGKCVRGVVDRGKLLADNPWKQFSWIEGYDRPIRQFDDKELLGLLDYLEQKWAGVTVACLMAKVLLWSGARRSEIASLTWDQSRVVGPERHFKVVGKWGVKRWFRIPNNLHDELLGIRTASPYVFAAYVDQLRRFYETSDRPGTAKVVNPSFSPVCFGDWFHERLVSWSKELPKGRAHAHIFRKTSLQYARRGEDASRKVAEDARVSECVLMRHYVEETDHELREASNRTYKRILASLPPVVTERYGKVEIVGVSVEDRLQQAIASQDWPLVAELAAQLSGRPQERTG